MARRKVCSGGACCGPTQRVCDSTSCKGGNTNHPAEQMSVWDVLAPPALTFRRRSDFFHFAHKQFQTYGLLLSISLLLASALYMVMLRPSGLDARIGRSHVSSGLPSNVYTAAIITMFTSSLLSFAAVANAHKLKRTAVGRARAGCFHQILLMLNTSVFLIAPLFDVSSQALASREQNDATGSNGSVTDMFARSHAQLSAATVMPLYVSLVGSSGSQMLLFGIIEVTALVILCQVQSDRSTVYELLVLDILRLSCTAAISAITFVSNVSTTFEIASLEAQHRSKSNFLQQIAHDLKSPTQALVNSIEQINEGQSMDDLKEMLDITTTYIRSTIDAALVRSYDSAAEWTIGRSENKKERMANLVRVNPANVVKNMIRVIETCSTTNAHVPMSLESSEKLPELVVTDQNIVEGILQNVLSNARKYTPNGHITVRVDAEDITQQEVDDIMDAKPGMKSTDMYPLSHKIHFCVKDTGIGIPPARRNYVFEMPYHRDYLAKAAGTGLGLWSAAQQARAVFGALKYDANDPEPGSTFTLTLPTRAVQSSLDARGASTVPRANVLDEPALGDDQRPGSAKSSSQQRKESLGSQSAERPASAATDSQSSVSGNAEANDNFKIPLTVLIADDTPLILHMLSKALRKLAETVLTASSGQQALEVWQNHDGRIDCIIADVNMPNGTGPELVRTLRQQERVKLLQPTTVCLMTGGSFPEADEHGIDYILAKPVRLNKLNSILSSVRDEKRRAEGGADDAEVGEKESGDCNSASHESQQSAENGGNSGTKSNGLVSEG